MNLIVFAIVESNAVIYVCFILMDLKDMKIEDPDVVDLVNQIEELEHKLFAHPLNKVGNSCMLFD